MSPAELESVLLLHPDVLDAAVLAVKDPLVGELPRAFVVLESRSSLRESDLVKFVHGQPITHVALVKLHGAS